MLTLASLGVIWGVVALAVYWNLKGKRILPTNEHCHIFSLFWPILLPTGIIYFVYRLFHAGAKKVVVGTASSFSVVVDTYKSGKLLPAKASAGNSLKPPSDIFEQQAKDEVDKLLKEI